MAYHPFRCIVGLVMKLNWDFPSILYNTVGHMVVMCASCVLAHSLGTFTGFFIAAPSLERFTAYFKFSIFNLMTPLLIVPSVVTGWGLLFYIPMAALFVWSLHDDESPWRWLAVGGIFLLAAGDAFRLSHFFLST